MAKLANHLNILSIHLKADIDKAYMYYSSMNAVPVIQHEKESCDHLTSNAVNATNMLPVMTVPEEIGAETKKRAEAANVFIGQEIM